MILLISCGYTHKPTRSISTRFRVDRTYGVKLPPFLDGNKTCNRITDTYVYSLAADRGDSSTFSCDHFQRRRRCFYFSNHFFFFFCIFLQFYSKSSAKLQFTLDTCRGRAYAVRARSIATWLCYLNARPRLLQVFVSFGATRRHIQNFLDYYIFIFTIFSRKTNRRITSNE